VNLKEALNSVRGGLALSSAVATFMAYAVQGYSAAIYKLLNPGKSLPDFLRRMPGRCANTMEKLCQHFILGSRTQIEGLLPQTDPANERQVYICNHPTNNVLPGLMNFLTTHFAPYFIAISKKENIRHPLAPLNVWPLLIMDSLLMIDREGGKSTIDQIREACQKTLGNNTGMWIFPDTKRPTTQAIQGSIETHGRLMPEGEPQYTCYPRRGGLHAILEGTKDFPTRFLTITTAFNRNDETLADAGKLTGATLHIAAEDVTEVLPRDEKGVGEWLNEEWVRKNRLIHQWRTAES
jgi:1-acyl-sn-glycerol-3-phosphate acyltransferase